MNARYAMCLPLLCLVFIAGCEVPAQMFWSLDGSRAAYFIGEGERSLVIDEQGSIIAELGEGTGGLAWSSDGGTLYFGAAATDPQSEATPIAANWLPEQHAQAVPASASTTAQTVVSRWTDGKAEAVFRLAEEEIVRLLVSPDDRWLAAVAHAKNAEGFRIYVYSLESDRLYLLSAASHLGAAFTGPDRLMFGEFERIDGNTISDLAKLVEVELNPTAGQLPRRPLLSVLKGVPWVQPMGEDLLFTGISARFPDQSHEEKFDLFHLARQSGVVTKLAENVGPLFMPSPDGQWILFERIIESAEGGQDFSLEVMRPNGSDRHVLRRPLRPGGLMGMWPAWRNNNEIALVAAEPPRRKSDINEEGNRAEVVLYQLSNAWELEPIRTLSGTWPDEVKPVVNAEAMREAFSPPATQPAAPEVE